MKENITAKIFDIRRFSTHDGDGIRTTIFFKGCNLNCVWCQNPEGISVKDTIIHFENRCIRCNKCKEIDKEKLIYEENNRYKFKTNDKFKLGKYIYECPVNALAMDSTEYTVKELMDEIKKDRVFYKQGGGITLSGGEPMLQYEFVVEFLKECKKEGIHTAIETAAFVNEDVIRNIIPYLDMAYVDLKIIDNEKHRKFTGVNNDKIKRNIEILLKSQIKDKVIVRTPMIPGYTATIKNVSEISEFISKIYSEVKYEILNYNPLAMSKYNLVEKEYCFIDNPKMFNKNQMEEFYNVSNDFGVKNLIKD